MDNVLPSFFHDCLISSAIGTVRGGGIQESSSSNSSSEPDVLDVSTDKMGKSCGLVKPFSLELYDVHIEEDTADYVEVEVYDKDAEREPMIIVKNLVGNVLNVSNISEETLNSQYGTLLEHTTSPKGRAKKNVDKTKKSLRKSRDNLQELKCSACQKVFSDSSDFHKHAEVHRSEKLYQCDQCCKTFRQLNHFNMHKQIHTERSFKCDICLETLKSNSSLKSHMKKPLGVKNHVCNVCPAAFHSKYELKIHNIKHAGDLPYSCLVCGDKFPVKSRLKRHMMIHTGERPFQCEVCGVIFREQLTLDIHMSVHLSRRPFVCDVCGEKFSRLNGLTLHQRVHKTDDTYSYVAKRKSSDEKDSLSSAKPPDSNSFIENCMGEELVSKIDSSHPLETKLESKTLNFPVIETSTSLKVDGTLPPCSSETTSAARCNLEKCLSEVEGTNIPHPGVIRDVLSSGTILKSQEDGKGYFIMLPRTLTEKNCTLYTAYPSSVVSSSKINESQVTSDKDNEQDSQNNDILFASDGHTDPARHSAIQYNQESDAEEVVTKFKKVKKLKSTICDDAASESVLYSRKMERSTKKKVKKANGSKFYQCDQCGRNYKTSSNLNVHLRTHTGERPYYCDFCGRGFKQMAHLQSHVRIHTGENPYQCDLCDQAFNQSSRLKYHIQNKHVSVRKKRVKVAKQYYVRNFYCKICDHTFIDSCYKSDHMRTHLQDRESKEIPESSKRNINLQHDVQQSVDFGICELCGFQYKDVKALRLHKEESHGITEDAKETADMLSNSTCSADSINQAKECTGSSYTKADSIINKETSTKDCVPCIKPLNCGKYECSVCHKTFKTRSNANIHLRLHSNVRPYVCSDCGKAFRQISHLKDHVKMHTGEKPFSCSVCYAAFAQSSSVKAHIKKCHKGQGSTIKSKKEQNIKQEFITVESVSPASNDTLVVSIESSH